ncbi:hypothetical protein [Lysobacter niastensis]|uniref:Uncharacterized protein n=1 Tax=Lysobacter niastensis TaxID=380629 RepID=A0ABS0B5L0_9GAMM|nr:hypothetical protein [Lysobacter niastensis]MBF6023972.1 hypothetical protein [Lysobacter niastensis]
MRPLIYIQVYRGHFIAKHLGNGKTIRRECAGLDHPRTLMGDFQKVQDSFAAVLKELLPPVNLLKPKGLVHLVPAYEGGYTNVETRAFKEAGEMAGVNFAFLSTQDRPHTDSEVLEVLR